MFVLCICINCKFYHSCWINFGLINFPLTKKELTTKISNKQYVKYLPTNLIINLELYVSTTLDINKREPDIIFCDAFVEKPGNWLL